VDLAHIVGQLTLYMVA